MPTVGLFMLSRSLPAAVRGSLLCWAFRRKISTELVQAKLIVIEVSGKEKYLTDFLEPISTLPTCTAVYKGGRAGIALLPSKKSQKQSRTTFSRSILVQQYLRILR